jgi:hypothetical protein
MILECSTFEDLRDMEGVRDIIDETGDVRQFMIGDVSVVRGFISACMDRLDALAVQQLHFHAGSSLAVQFDSQSGSQGTAISKPVPFRIRVRPLAVPYRRGTAKDLAAKWGLPDA